MKVRNPRLELRACWPGDELDCLVGDCVKGGVKNLLSCLT